MAFMLWLLLTLQVWNGESCGSCDSSGLSGSGGAAAEGAAGAVDRGTDDAESSGSAGAGAEGAAVGAGSLSPGHLVAPGVDAQSVTDFFNNMSSSAEIFDQVSYHRGPVVLRGVLNNRVCQAVAKALPSQMTDSFSHHWLEFHVANPNLSARILVDNSTELQVVKLHFMDNGFQWKFGNSSAPKTEVARSKQVIEPMQVLALAQDPPQWRPFTNNCQDLSFQQWNLFVTESNAVPTPLATKITAFVVDSTALVVIILLICVRKKCFKRNQQTLDEPLLKQ